MSIPQDRLNSDVLPAQDKEVATESIVTANKFILIDSEGKERASLFLQNDMAMLALNDKDEEWRLLLAVTPEGFTIVSATHRKNDGTIDDSFRLLVAGGEPELTMRDAIFGDAIGMNTRGFFNPARA